MKYYNKDVKIFLKYTVVIVCNTYLCIKAEGRIWHVYWISIDDSELGFLCVCVCVCGIHVHDHACIHNFVCDSVCARTKSHSACATALFVNE